MLSSLKAARYIPFTEVIIMDIAALSSAMSYSQLHMNVGYALTAKVMDQVEEASMELLEMLEGAIPSDLGQFVDIRA